MAWGITGTIAHVFRQVLMATRLLEDIVELSCLGYPNTFLRSLAHSLPCGPETFQVRRVIMLWIRGASMGRSAGSNKSACVHLFPRMASESAAAELYWAMGSATFTTSSQREPQDTEAGFFLQQQEQ
eukprot:3933630-Amphidinium_carterae.1